MLFGICITLCVALQVTEGCWSTTFVYLDDVLTEEQSETLYELSQELQELSCEQLEERVYNDSSEPPIQLTEDQVQNIQENYEPCILDKDLMDTDIKLTFSKRSVQQFELTPPTCNDTDTTSRKKRGALDIHICPSDSHHSAYHFGFDRHGDLVYIPQSIKYGFLQEFQEMLCSDAPCATNLDCRCQSQRTHYVRALVSYMGRGELHMFTTHIQLRSCIAYRPG